eukprot:459855-Amphidinium_carterae.1
MEQKGWNTFNRLASATGYVPGRSKEEMFKEDIAQPILGPEHATSLDEVKKYQNPTKQGILKLTYPRGLQGQRAKGWEGREWS